MELGNVWIISILRILIIGFMFGSGMSIIYGLAGAVISLIVMALMKKINGFSIMGISMIGAVAHNMGQIVVAMFVVENTSILYYVPALLIAGLITGGIIGIVSKRVLTVIKR